MTDIVQTVEVKTEAVAATVATNTEAVAVVVANTAESAANSAVTAVEGADSTAVQAVEKVAETAATAVVDTAKEVKKVTVAELSYLANTAVTEVQIAQKNLVCAKAKAASILDGLEMAASAEKNRIQKELSSWMEATTAEINKVVTLVREIPAETEVKAKEVEQYVKDVINDGVETIEKADVKHPVLAAAIFFAAGIVVTVGTFLIFFR